jgi:hypothetical protein
MLKLSRIGSTSSTKRGKGIGEFLIILKIKQLKATCIVSAFLTTGRLKEIIFMAELDCLGHMAWKKL